MKRKLWVNFRASKLDSFVSFCSRASIDASNSTPITFSHHQIWEMCVKHPSCLQFPARAFELIHFDAFGFAQSGFRGFHGSDSVTRATNFVCNEKQNMHVESLKLSINNRWLRKNNVVTVETHESSWTWIFPFTISHINQSRKKFIDEFDVPTSIWSVKFETRAGMPGNFSVLEVACMNFQGFTVIWRQRQSFWLPSLHAKLSQFPLESKPL